MHFAILTNDWWQLTFVTCLNRNGTGGTGDQNSSSAAVTAIAYTCVSVSVFQFHFTPRSVEGNRICGLWGNFRVNSWFFKVLRNCDAFYHHGNLRCSRGGYFPLNWPKRMKALPVNSLEHGIIIHRTLWSSAEVHSCVGISFRLKPFHCAFVYQYYPEGDRSKQSFVLLRSNNATLTSAFSFSLFTNPFDSAGRLRLKLWNTHLQNTSKQQCEQMWFIFPAFDSCNCYFYSGFHV